MNQQNSERGLKLWGTALTRGLVLMVVTVNLCSCGVYQVVDSLAHPNDDDKGLTAAMDIMIPPLLIIGDWPPDTSAPTPKPPTYYTGIIRTRNDGKMTPQRSRDILDAMYHVFQDTALKDMSEPEIEKLIGPPDKTMVRSGKNIDVYQVHTPSGLQERWLVRA